MKSYREIWIFRKDEGGNKLCKSGVMMGVGEKWGRDGWDSLYIGGIVVIKS